jgi:hypothetical protein
MLGPIRSLLDRYAVIATRRPVVVDGFADKWTGLIVPASHQAENKYIDPALVPVRVYDARRQTAAGFQWEQAVSPG